MHHKFLLKNGAFIVSDAHFSSKRGELLEFLSSLDSGRLSTPQLILLGDNFDFLSSAVDDAVDRNRSAIEILNRVSKRVEVVIFEGNHDFNLEPLFPNSLVITRAMQPLNTKIGNQKVTFAHGDLDIGIFYEIYRRVVECYWLLRVLNWLNIIAKNRISSAIFNKLDRKKLCKELENFQNLAEKRLESIDSDFFIEGHYHQGKIYNQNGKIYASVPALICKKSFFLVEFEKEVLTLSFQNF